MYAIGRGFAKASQAVVGIPGSNRHKLGGEDNRYHPQDRV